MLRGVIATAAESGRVAVFLEPIALYHEKDLYEAGDGGWLADYPLPHGPDAALLPGEVGVYHPAATDLLIVSYANGLRMALRAARRLRDEDGVEARVVDLWWLAPLPHAAFARTRGRVRANPRRRRVPGHGSRRSGRRDRRPGRSRDRTTDRERALGRHLHPARPRGRRRARRRRRHRARGASPGRRSKLTLSPRRSSLDRDARWPSSGRSPGESARRRRRPGALPARSVPSASLPRRAWPGTRPSRRFP